MKIFCSRDAFHCLRPLLKAEVEEVWAIALRPNKTVINLERIFKGTVDSCLIHPRDIFRFALKQNASGLLIAHNHPGQDPSPSKEDLAVTKDLIKAGRLLQIPVLDHIILAGDDYCSISDNGFCRF